MYVTLADFMLYGKYTTKTHFIHSMFVKKRRLGWICRAECLFLKYRKLFGYRSYFGIDINETSNFLQFLK